jgi:hypothetical protein
VLATVAVGVLADGTVAFTFTPLLTVGFANTVVGVSPKRSSRSSRGAAEADTDPEEVETDGREEDEDKDEGMEDEEDEDDDKADADEA